MDNLIRSITRTALRDILQMRIVEFSLNDAKKMVTDELDCFAKEAEEDIHKLSGHELEAYLSKYYSLFYELQNNIDLIVSIINKSVRAAELVRERPVFCCVGCDSIADSLFCGRTCIERAARLNGATAQTPLVPSIAPPIGTVSNPRNEVSTMTFMLLKSYLFLTISYWHFQSIHKSEIDDCDRATYVLTEGISKTTNKNLHIATTSNDRQNHKISVKVC